MPTGTFIKGILHNPFYAGAYAYGKREGRICYKEGHIKKTHGHLKKREDWLVLIKEHHEGYISWEEYEENIKRMSTNQYKAAPDETVGAVRKGRGLLVGILRCQRCGRKMQVRYWGKNGTNPRYVCQGEFYYGGSYCQSFSAIKTDRVFEEELFRAIEPAALQASIEDVTSSINDIRKRLPIFKGSLRLPSMKPTGRLPSTTLWILSIDWWHLN